MNPVRRRPQMDAEVEAFNGQYAVGELLWVYPAEVGGRLEEVEIRRPGAYVLGGHTPVVQVAGGHGCIALTHVRGWKR